MPETEQADIAKLLNQLLAAVEQLGENMAGQLAEVRGQVEQLAGQVTALEAEFAPLARKYSGVISAAARIPGVGMGRGRSNGRVYNAGAPGASSWPDRPRG